MLPSLNSSLTRPRWISSLIQNNRTSTWRDLRGTSFALISCWSGSCLSVPVPAFLGGFLLRLLCRCLAISPLSQLDKDIICCWRASADTKEFSNIRIPPVIDLLWVCLKGAKLASYHILHGWYGFRFTPNISGTVGCLWIDPKRSICSKLDIPSHQRVAWNLESKPRSWRVSICICFINNA